MHLTYTFDSLASIRLINKETEDKDEERKKYCLKKMNF